MASQKSVFAPESRVTLRAVHFEESDELTIRIYSERGSTPIMIVENGKQVSYEEIGKALCEALTYFIPIEEYAV